MISTSYVALLGATAATLCAASNPLVPGVGQADPHIHVFGDTFYLYSTHDFAPNNTNFLMKDWWVWSSPDLVEWTKESVVLPQDTPSPSNEWDSCWATDAATNGTHYAFYLSLGPDQVGVMLSETPVGPWDNVLGKPLLNSSLGASLNPPTTIRDPCAFREDDGSHYIVFGTFTYYVARLAPDLVSLAEEPKLITIVDALGQYGYNKTDDKPFLHKANGLYYLSWGGFYGIGSSPYGPFTYAGSVISTSAIDPAFRINQTTGPWYGWEDQQDRHGSFWTANGQWYFAANDRSHSTDLKNPSYYRDTVVGYVHYLTNGSIAPVRIDATGVGQYDAAHIEAEDYFSLRGAVKGHDSEGRFGVHGITPSSQLVYPHVRSVPASPELRFVASNAGRATAVVTARVGAADGPILCRAVVPPSGDWEAYATSSCRPSGSLGLKGTDMHDMRLVLAFEAAEEWDGGELLRLDSLALVNV